MGKNFEGCCNSSRSVLAVCIILGFLCVTAVVIAVVFIIIEEKSPISADDKGDTTPITDPGEPLFLTPLIESGELEKALNLSRVSGFGEEVYSGFITIDKKYNSNLYFIFFPARKNVDTAPVILWMNGGPGNPSISCMTECSGPFLVDEQQHISANTVSWTEKYSIIYVDQPVGTGFSFTDDKTAMAVNQDDIAEGMFSFLHQFFTIFAYHRNDFYILGRSYGGKYAPSVATKIHKENPKAQLKINLKGLAIVSGFCDPANMIRPLADYAFYNGLLTEAERDYMQSRFDETIDLINQKNYSEAMQVYKKVYLGAVTYFKNVTGVTNFYDLRKPEDSKNLQFSKFIKKTSTRRAFHVGNRTFSDGNEVYDKLMNDLLVSVKNLYEDLLASNYSILFYNGQFDIVVNVASTESFIWNLNWTDNATYKNATKKLWKVNSELAGFIRKGGNLYQAVVLGAGHEINSDQRQRSFDLIQRFIEGRLFSD